MKQTLLFLFFYVVLAAGCSSPTGSVPDKAITTNIAFSIPENGPVLITLENAYHSEIKIILQEDLPQGSYFISITMDDKNEQPLPEGLYFARIRTGEFDSRRRLFLSYD